MATRTFTALFTDAAAAETAMERLRAIGIPERSLEMHKANEGDVAPGNVPSGGLFAVGDLLNPGNDRQGLEAGSTVVVALHVPGELASQAKDILEEGAIEVDEDRERG
jgi:hypothetical protein